MARQIRDAKLDTRAARLRLTPTKKPYLRLIEPGLHLAYRRLTDRPGTWAVRKYLGTSGQYRLENLRTRDGQIVLADDNADADGVGILSFAQAQLAARGVAHTTIAAQADKPVTVREAVVAYKESLKDRGGDPGNADRVLLHLPEGLASIAVARLKRPDFKPWIANLKKQSITPSTIDRTNTCLKAALNRAADQDESIEVRPWAVMLKGEEGATEARNVILDTEVVWGIVDACHKRDPFLGEFAELIAVTGARPVQVARLTVADLKAERAAPRVMMPSALKGKGKKTVVYKPVPIPFDLALRLRERAKDRRPSDPLMTRACGDQWNKSCHNRPFDEAVGAYDAALLVGDDRVTMYAFRHSSIVRQLIAGVPIRVVASNHDTSVAMIEKHYSKHISDHADALVRAAMLARPQGANVVPMR